MTISTTRLGIIGGVIGLIVGIIVFVLGARSISPWSPSGAIIAFAVISSLIFVFAILGLVGGAITKERPVAGGVLMLVGGIGGFLSGLPWLPAGILLLIGGIRSLKQRT